MHRFHALVLTPEVTLSHGGAYQFRNRSFLGANACVESTPKIVVKANLNAPHDL
jgi:hypothetical protein